MLHQTCVVNVVAGGARPACFKLWHIAGSKRLSGSVDCGRRRWNVYDKKPQRYAKDNRTAHLTARNNKSVAYITNNKRLYSRFCTVEANYWQTRSIAQPLCDSRATCWMCVYSRCCVPKIIKISPCLTKLQLAKLAHFLRHSIDVAKSSVTQLMYLTDRQTDRETEGQTDGQTGGQRDRKTDRQADRERDRQMEWRTDGQKDRWTSDFSSVTYHLTLSKIIKPTRAFQ